MKKVLLLSSVIIILGLTGCSNKYFNDWFSSEQNETDKMCQQIIEACKQQDSEKLKSLFLSLIHICGSLFILCKKNRR